MKSKQWYSIYYNNKKFYTQNFFCRAKMGAKQFKRQNQRRIQQKYADQWSIVFDNKQNYELDETTHVQLFETKNFQFSKPILASRNLMDGKQHVPDLKPQQKNLVFQLFRKIPYKQQDEEILVIPIITSILSNFKIKKPLYSMIEIDPKKFIVARSDPIHNSYAFLKQIGKGSFGTVFKAESLSQRGEFRAIKRIEISKMDNKQKLSLINEFQILKKLDHPNIIKIYEIFEDKQYYYVVSELCEGGDLLDFINLNCLSEECVKLLMQQILSAVKYMHNLQVLHRDLKLENVVVVEDKTSKTKNQKLQIKIIDFGLSIDLKKVCYTIVDEAAGTLIYMSPQALTGSLTLASDIWSCGIILYMLVTKKIPYKYQNEEEAIEKIQKGYISRKYLHKLNIQLKMLINFMIEIDPARRYTAEKALNCEWLKNSSSKPGCLTVTQKRKAAASLLSYNMQNNLVAMVESYLAFKKISQSERQRLAKIFQEIDKDRSGVIDIATLKHFYSEYSQNYCQKQVEELLKLIDKNKSGKIDFNEFIGAVFNHRRLFSARNLEEVYDYLDNDRSGQISKNELREALNGIEDEQIEHLFQELDKNQDNCISKQEFVMYIQKEYQR